MCYENEEQENSVKCNVFNWLISNVDVKTWKSKFKLSYIKKIQLLDSNFKTTLILQTAHAVKLIKHYLKEL